MNLFPQTIDVKIQVKSGNLIQDTHNTLLCLSLVLFHNLFYKILPLAHRLLYKGEVLFWIKREKKGKEINETCDWVLGSLNCHVGATAPLHLCSAGPPSKEANVPLMPGHAGLTHRPLLSADPSSESHQCCGSPAQPGLPGPMVLVTRRFRERRTANIDVNTHVCVCISSDGRSSVEENNLGEK